MLKSTPLLILIPLCSLLSLAPAEAKTPPAQAEAEYGDAWSELGNWKRALGHYRKALKLQPGMRHARIGLAEGLLSMGKNKAALSEIKKLDPKAAATTEAACLNGRIWLAMAKPQQACQAFELALQAKTNNPEALYGAGVCQEALYKEHASQSARDKAKLALSAYLEHNPEGPRAQLANEALRRLALGHTGMQLQQARELFAQGEGKAAEKLLRQVIAAQPKLQRAHTLLGRILASPTVDRVAAARAEWLQAPDDAEAMLQLGLLDFEDDYLERARDRFLRAIELSPRNPEPHYHLGLVHRPFRSAPGWPATPYQSAQGRRYQRPFFHRRYALHLQRPGGVPGCRDAGLGRCLRRSHRPRIGPPGPAPRLGHARPGGRFQAIADQQNPQCALAQPPDEGREPQA